MINYRLVAAGFFTALLPFDKIPQEWVGLAVLGGFILGYLLAWED